MYNTHAYTHTLPSYKTTDHDDNEKWQYNDYCNDCSYYYVDTTAA